MWPPPYHHGRDTMSTYEITTKASGRNFAHIATVRRGGRVVHATDAYPTGEIARAHAEAWVRKQGALR